MQKILINITDALRGILDEIASESETSLSETVEMLLRDAKKVRAKRKDWPERTQRGRPKSV